MIESVIDKSGCDEMEGFVFMKWKTRLLPISAFLFFAIMLFLTCFAKDIKNAKLTHVQAETLPLKMFLLEGVDGNGAEGSVRQKCYALPERLLKEGVIYRVDSEIVNGEECFFVRKVELLTGEEADGCYPVLSDDYQGEKVVIYSEKPLQEGEEVYLIP